MIWSYSSDLSDLSGWFNNCFQLIHSNISINLHSIVNQFDSSDRLIESIDLIVMNNLVNIIVLKVNLKLDAYNIHSYLIRRNTFWWTRTYPIQYCNNLPMATDLNQMSMALLYVGNWEYDSWLFRVRFSNAWCNDQEHLYQYQFSVLKPIQTMTILDLTMEE